VGRLRQSCLGCVSQSCLAGACILSDGLAVVDVSHDGLPVLGKTDTVLGESHRVDALTDAGYCRGCRETRIEIVALCAIPDRVHALRDATDNWYLADRIEGGVAKLTNDAVGIGELSSGPCGRGDRIVPRGLAGVCDIAGRVVGRVPVGFCLFNHRVEDSFADVLDIAGGMFDVVLALRCEMPDAAEYAHRLPRSERTLGNTQRPGQSRSRSRARVCRLT